MVSYEILNGWWCFCHFVCLGSAELLNPTSLLANGVCCCSLLGRGMQFKAFVPQRFASINLSGGLSTSSIFESLDKSLHTVVPFVSVLSTVEGADNVKDNLGQGSVLLMTVDLRSLASNVHFTFSLCYLVFLESLFQLSHFASNIISMSGSLVELVLVVCAVVLIIVISLSV